MTIISISGKKQSGKDTLASFISTELLIKSKGISNVAIVGFADAVKIDIAKMFRVPVSFIEVNKSSFRLILQGYGTDYMRKLVNPNHWVERLLKSINELPDYTIVIVKDTRFQNEFDSLKRIGAFMVHLNRESEVVDKHASETELDNCKEYDMEVYNNFTLEHLKEQAKEIVKRLKL